MKNLINRLRNRPPEPSTPEPVSPHQQAIDRITAAKQAADWRREGRRKALEGLHEELHRDAARIEKPVKPE
jgi:hypothetical protein